MFARRVVRVVGALATAAALASGCAVPGAVIGPDGRLEVLGPGRGFSPARLPGDWAVEGSEGTVAKQVAVVQKNGIPALRVANGSDRFGVFHRTRTLLLVTPYLSWAWNVETQGPGLHPVGLTVGFHGGDPAGGGWGSRPLGWLGSELPPHDRVLAIGWGDSALQRGSLEEGDAPRPPRVGYVQRGGRENADSWFLETVDLAELYARAWPGDDAGRVEVVFIGITAAGGGNPAAAHFSGILLSR